MARAKEAYDPRYISKSEIRSAGRAVRPRDAATLIVVRRDGRSPRVLMGKRSAAHKFMPNKCVFPGGRVDAGDGRLRPPHDLHPQVLARLALILGNGDAARRWAEEGLARNPMSATLTLIARELADPTAESE